MPMEKTNKVENADKDFRYIVRIANTDLEGNKIAASGLRKIRGISFSISNIICNAAKIDKSKKIGNLSEAEIGRINDVIKNTADFFPKWMLNSRKGYEDGSDRHLFSSDLDFEKENSVRLLKKIRSYRGIRHMLGQPVRGQRTKSNFRRNKGKVTGVKKSSQNKGRV